MNVLVILAFVICCVQITPLHSRTSALWRLNENGKITASARRSDEDVVNLMPPEHNNEQAMSSASRPPPSSQNDVYAHDEIFYIIASTLSESGGGGSDGGGGVGWVRQSPETLLLVNGNGGGGISNGGGGGSDKPNRTLAGGGGECANGVKGGKSNIQSTTATETTTSSGGGGGSTLVAEETLDCGKPVNFTYYDYLIGVGHRFNHHPLVPEPEVAYLFLKSKDENAYKNFDIKALERRLKKNKRERPRSVQLYNQIGNYWRIVGDARQAIECFRRALAMSPTNAEVLLNLARVLYNLQYLDDAIHLTRRSLEMQPPGRSAWQQYFTLGEIFKAYGHFQESILHLRHALELYPHHEPILKALRDVENSPSSTLHVYTVVIIVALVVAVFIVIITSSSSDCNSNGGNKCNTSHHHHHLGSSSNNSAGNSGGSDCEPRRHFNRAMAMRSLKGLGGSSSSRQFRHRRN